IPAFFKVIYQGLRFILWKDQDLIELRIDAVAQWYIDQPVYAPKWDGGFGTVPGQRHQPRPLASGHDYGQHILHWSCFLLRGYLRRVMGSEGSSLPLYLTAPVLSSKTK